MQYNLYLDSHLIKCNDGHHSRYGQLQGETEGCCKKYKEKVMTK